MKITLLSALLGLLAVVCAASPAAAYDAAEWADVESDLLLALGDDDEADLDDFDDAYDEDDYDLLDEDSDEDSADAEDEDKFYPGWPAYAPHPLAPYGYHPLAPFGYHPLAPFGVHPAVLPHLMAARQHARQRIRRFLVGLRLRLQGGEEGQARQEAAQGPRHGRQGHGRRRCRARPPPPVQEAGRRQARREAP